jgi:hypothetical protein
MGGRDLRLVAERRPARVFVSLGGSVGSNPTLHRDIWPATYCVLSSYRFADWPDPSSFPHFAALPGIAPAESSFGRLARDETIQDLEGEANPEIVGAADAGNNVASGRAVARSE